MRKQFLNPASLPKWNGSFSQVVVVGPSTRTVYVSGQVAMDVQNRVVGSDLATQAEKAFQNLVTALEAGGARPGDVVKLTLYLKNYRPEQASIIREVMRKHFPDEPLPAATWLGVESLALEGLLIEIDAIAMTA